MSIVNGRTSSSAVHGDDHDVHGCHDRDENGSPMTINGMRNEMVVDEGRCGEMSDGDDDDRDDGGGGDDECGSKQIEEKDEEDDEGGGKEEGANEEEEEEEGNQLVDREYGEEEKEEEEKNEEEKEDCKVGLDGGYGWVVVSASFLAWGLGATFIKGLGIFFLQFQERFHTSAMLTAWPGSALWMIQYFTGPLVAAVCNRYSVRTALMIGTSLIFIGLILNSAVDNFYFLFFCFSLLQGAGLSFLINPGAFIVSSYFDKRRGFAVSLAATGAAAGNFVLVPLVNLLFESFGYQGCFLVLAGIMTNGYVIAMLYRPFHVHQKYLLGLHKTKIRTACPREYVDDVDNGCNSNSIPLSGSKSDTIQHTTHYHTTHRTGHTSTSCPSDHHTHQINCNDQKMSKLKNPIETAIQKEKGGKITTCFSRVKTCLKILFPTDYERKENAPRRKMLHFGILKDVTYLLFLSGTVLFTVVLASTNTFIPALCVDKGLTEAEAALVVSIVGVVDLFVRVGIGFVLDMPKMRPHRVLIFGGLLFVMALMGFCLPSLSSFVSFVVVCSVLDACLGSHSSQRAVVLVDLFGKEMLPSCTGITRMFQVFGILTGPLLFGALRDATGSYDTAFYVSSCLAIVGGVFFVLCYILHQRRLKDKEQEQPGPRQQLTSSV